MTEQLRPLLSAAYECPYKPGGTRRIAYTNRTPTQAETANLIARGWVYSITDSAATTSQCSACNACWPIRVKAKQYEPNRSQRRTERANQDTRLVIGRPIHDQARVELYRRHHLARQQRKGWADSANYGQTFIKLAAASSVPVIEFAFFRDDKLVAVSYANDLADALFGAYFYYDPDYRHLSLGTWIVMNLIYEAAARGFEYAYLGTYVAGCGSLEYKSAFSPNQVRKPLRPWEDFA